MFVCSFLDGAFEPRTAEQGEFIRRLTTSGGCSVDMGDVVLEIRKHVIVEGGVGKFRFASDQR